MQILWNKLIALICSHHIIQKWIVSLSFTVVTFHYWTVCVIRWRDWSQHLWMTNSDDKRGQQHALQQLNNKHTHIYRHMYNWTSLDTVSCHYQTTTEPRTKVNAIGIAHTVVKVPKFSHIRSILWSLHWPKINEHTGYKQVYYKWRLPVGLFLLFGVLQGSVLHPLLFLLDMAELLLLNVGSQATLTPTTRYQSACQLGTALYGGSTDVLH